MINKFLCWLGWHKYEFDSLMPTGKIDSFGDPTYCYQISIHKCKWCHKKKTVIHTNDDPFGIFKP